MKIGENTKKYLTLGLLVLFIVLGFSVAPTQSSAQQYPPGQTHPGQCTEEDVEINPTCRLKIGQEFACICDDAYEKAAEVAVALIQDPLLQAVNGVGSSILNAVAGIFSAIAALILFIAGIVLNLSVEHTIIGMSELVNNVGAINIAWTLIRDVANIAFIFIILIIAISLILRIGQFNSKSLLIKIIVVALLINFSLFFTRVIIDASNIIAIELYQPLAAIDTKVAVGQLPNSVTEKAAFYGISGAFIDKLSVLGAYNPSNFLEPSNIIRQIMGGIFMLIAAFVFLLAAILLIIRFVVFIILMITSPIAWLGMFLPAMKTYANKWWGAMLNQAFFAPILMLMFTLSYLVISDESFTGTIAPSLNTGGNLGQAFQAGDPGSVAIILNFIIGIGFLIASIIIAKTMAATGSGGAVKWATQKAGRASFGAAAFAGRHTLGRAGRALSDPKTKLGGRISTLSNSNSAIARTFGRGLGAGAGKLKKGSFDAAGVISTAGVDTGKAQKGGFEKIRKDKAKREAGYMKAGGEARGAQEVRKSITEKRAASKIATKDLKATMQREGQLRKEIGKKDTKSINLAWDTPQEQYLEAQKEREAAEVRAKYAKNSLRGADSSIHEKELAKRARSLSTTQTGQALKYLELYAKKEKAIKDDEDFNEDTKLDEMKRGLDKDQARYANSTIDLAEIKRADGKTIKAAKELEFTKHTTSYSGPRREEAQKGRAELRKNEDQKLLKKLQDLAKGADGDGDKKGGEDKSKGDEDKES